MKFVSHLVLLGLSTVCSAGEPSSALPLASARRVPAGRVDYVVPAHATASMLVKYEGGSSFEAEPQSIVLDERVVATIEKREFVTFDVAPGHHVVGIRDARPASEPATIGITASANSSYYFRISQTATGSRVFQLSSGPDD
jgi:hypothetical protein